MKNRMILITVLLLIGFAVSLSVFIVTRNAVIETVTISIGVSLYHFAMRLAVGSIVNLIMKNRADYTSIWFREKSFEKRVCKAFRVRVWKDYLPTYSPETFDTSQKTIKELVGATCQAEIVHVVIMVLSLLPIALIPLLGGAVAMIITSILAMLIDLAFVILQRYNRPKLIRAIERFEKLK